MSIAWSAEARELHLRNDEVSYVMRVHEDGSLGHLYFGAALATDAPLAHVEPAGFEGFSNPRRRPDRARIPDDRWRRLPDPRPDHRARRRVERPGPQVRRAPHRPGQTGLGGERPAGDLRRGRRRGRDADRGRHRCRQQPDRRAPLHDLPRSAGRRSQCPHPQWRDDGGPPDRGDERDARPAGRSLGAPPAQRRLGAREPCRCHAPAPRSPVGRQRPGRLEPTSTTRSWPSSAPRRPRSRARSTA